MSEILSAEAVAEMLARAEAATPGPWVYMDCYPYDDEPIVMSADLDKGGAHICRNIDMDDRPDDFQFIAEAREMVPALCASHEALTWRGEALEEERDAIKDAMLAWMDTANAARDNILRQARRIEALEAGLRAVRDWLDFMPCSEGERSAIRNIDALLAATPTPDAELRLLAETMALAAYDTPTPDAEKEN